MVSVVVIGSYRQVDLFRSAQSMAILLSVWSALKGSQKVVGVMRRIIAVVAMVARCRVNSFHVLTKASAVTGVQLCQYSSCLLGSVCSSMAMDGGRPLSNFDELLSMVVLTASWWMLLSVSVLPHSRYEWCSRLSIGLNGRCLFTARSPTANDSDLSPLVKSSFWWWCDRCRHCCSNFCFSVPAISI